MAFDEFKGDFAPLVRMVHNHAKNRPNGVAMRQKEFGIWNEITWEGLQEIMQASRRRAGRSGAEHGRSCRHP